MPSHSDGLKTGFVTLESDQIGTVYTLPIFLKFNCLSCTISFLPSGSDSMALAGWAKPSTAYTTPSPTPSAFLSSPAGSALTQSTLVLFLGALFSSRTHHFHLVSPLRLFPLPGQTLLHLSRTSSSVSSQQSLLLDQKDRSCILMALGCGARGGFLPRRDEDRSEEAHV